MKKKKDLFWVEAAGLNLGVDFEVVTNTPFDEELVYHFYELENHEIDVELAVMLGLGVVKNLHWADGYYIYNASNDHPNNFGIMYEVTRIDVYYQITHPEFDHKDLEEFIIGTERGKRFLRKLQTVDSDEPFERLKDVFDRRKGNVIPMNR